MQTNEKIVALGVGRKGCQIVEQMPGKIEGVEFVSVNDADECKEIIDENFLNSDIIFVIGDSPLISDMAKATKEAGTLTVGISLTNNGELNAAFKESSDAFISFDENISWNEQIKRSQNIVETIADLITKSGFVNLDFDDIKAILQDTGTALFRTGHAEGDDRAKLAALQAVNMCGEVRNAKRVLINITTGSEVGLGEMSDAAGIIEEVCAPEAQVIWGHVIDDEMGNDFQVAFIAGMDNNK